MAKRILRFKLLASLFSLLLLLLACGGEGGDPVIPGDGSPGSGRANEEFTVDNCYEAFTDFLQIIHNSHTLAIGVTTAANDADNPARFLGNYSGLANVRVIDPDTSVAGITRVYYLETEYRNFYADSGYIFINGTLQVCGLWGDEHIEKLFLSGSVEFSGDYACGVEFIDFPVALEPNGQLVDLVRLASEDPRVREYYLKYVGRNNVAISGDVFINHADGSKSRFYPHKFLSDPPGQPSVPLLPY